MRKYLFINIVFLLLMPVVLQAEELATDSIRNPFQVIAEKESWRSGEVHFYQDERIEALVRENIPAENTIVDGYRVQVFSSNAHSTAKRNAFNIEQKLKASYPYMPIYISYSSPFWKVRIGDFLTQEEARLFLNELVRNLPELRTETYIVRERISLSPKTN